MPVRSIAERVRVWDRALATVHAHMRSRGLAEVVTDLRRDEVALEPWIDPVASGASWLVTSPELALKTLVAHGAGAIYQLAHVWRAGERGRWHRPEFHLVEWYRPGAELAALHADVESLVAAMIDALAPWATTAVSTPRWRSETWLELFAATTGIVLAGDEGPDELAVRVRGTALASWPAPPPGDDDMRRLWAYSALFSAWSDACLDPWLAARAQAGEAVHLVAFPPALAALSRLDRDAHGRTVALRFESHVFGRELCNGYDELRDASEQRRRFAAVARMRAAAGQGAIGLPEAFLAVLAHPGLPACVGAALGLERLVACALGADGLEAIALDP